jgi:hypothetical protein
MGILSRLKREERAREAALLVHDRTAHCSVEVSTPAPMPVQGELDLDLSKCYSVNEASAVGFSLKKYNEELDRIATAATRVTGRHPKLKDYEKKGGRS